MIFNLVQDFADFLNALPREHPRRRILALLDEAIRRDVHFFDRHPTTLFQCLWNTCWWYDCPESECHFTAPADDTSAPRPPEERTDAALFRLLESWRELKEACTPRFVWLRSLRPPQFHIGSAMRGVLKGHSKFVNGIAYSPDGRHIVSASSDNTLRVWDAASGVEVGCIDGHEDTVNAVAYCPTGRCFASGSLDTTVRIWDAQVFAPRHCLRGHDDGVTGVAFSPDGTRLVSSSMDRSLRVWEVQTGVCLCGLHAHEDRARCVTYSPDGQWLVSADDKTLLKWDAASGSPVKKLAIAGVGSVAFSPDGCRVIAGSWDHQVRIFDFETLNELKALPALSSAVTSVAYSPDGRRIAATAGGLGMSGGGLTASNWAVVIFDAESGQVLSRLCGHEQPVYDVAYSPDGQWITSAGADLTLRIWNSQDRRELAVLTNHEDSIESLAFSDDGKWVLSGGWDGTVRVWETKTGRQLKCFRGHRSVVWCVALSADKQQIVSGSQDQSVQVWDIASAERIACLDNFGDVVKEVEFTQDSHRIRAKGQGKSHRIWDTAVGTCTVESPSNASPDPFDNVKVRLPLRALTQDAETLLMSVSTGKTVAWFSTALSGIVIHPSSLLAAHSGSHLYVLALEGDIEGRPSLVGGGSHDVVEVDE